MFSLRIKSEPPVGLLDSQLLNEDTFYPMFLKDLSKCQSELIVECPFVTYRRLSMLSPTLEELKARKVRVAINTRDPQTHGDEYMRGDAHDAISKLQHMGIQVLYTGNHHRKLAILDRRVLYEGSLNILSQNNSCEVMRRIESVQLAWQMTKFVGIDKYLN